MTVGKGSHHIVQLPATVEPENIKSSNTANLVPLFGLTKFLLNFGLIRCEEIWQVGVSQVDMQADDSSIHRS